MDIAIERRSRQSLIDCVCDIRAKLVAREVANVSPAASLHDQICVEEAPEVSGRGSTRHVRFGCVAGPICAADEALLQRDDEPIRLAPEPSWNRVAYVRR